MKIALATDHAGFAHKEAIAHALSGDGHEVVDHGAFSLVPGDDYPQCVRPAAAAVAQGEASCGVILGGSGQGEAIVANRIAGVRAAVYYGGPLDIIRLSREHNDANVLSLGARFLSVDDAVAAVRLFLATSFSGEERHVRRLGAIDTAARSEIIPTHYA